MNQAKLEKILREQTSVAGKVYQVVPAGDAWTKAQIQSELVRAGVVYDFKKTSGCLQSLAEDGVIREPQPGKFIRATISGCAKPKEPKEAKKPAKPALIKAPEPDNAFDELSGLIAVMADSVHRMAHLLEEVELEVEQRLEDIEGKSDKLNQLGRLLKSLGE